MQVQQSPVRGIGYLTEATWDHLLQLNRNVHLRLQQGVPHVRQLPINPVVLTKPFKGPQLYRPWLHEMATSLLEIEATHHKHLMGDWGSEPLTEHMFQKLCSLEATAAQAYNVSTGWANAEHGATLWLHPAWAGHVPWSQSLPEPLAQSADEAAKALLLTTDEVRSPWNFCKKPMT